MVGEFDYNQINDVRGFMVMPKIFISYRRMDSQDFTDRLFDYMGKHFGTENVFQDVGDTTKILPGVDFVEYLAEQVSQCDVVLVVIGEHWLQILQERANQDNDFVRIEVESALTQKKIVIPILKSNATMPSSDELPVNLQSLARRNASRVRPNPDFAKDCDVLAEGIKTVMRGRVSATISQSDMPIAKVAEIATPLTPLQQAIQLAYTFRSSSNSQWKPYVVQLGKLLPKTILPDIEMCLVPVGTFVMGSDEGKSNEKPPHQQTITKPFWIAKYPITNEQWAMAVSKRIVQPVQDADALAWFADSTLKNVCVTSVNWFQAQKFAEWLGCQLPMEHLWEYATRGVESLVYPWGNEFLADNVVYADNSNQRPQDVATRPNGASWVGAMHLCGNVWEWCSSIYKQYPYDDHAESVNKQNTRVLRGGSWTDSAIMVRATTRNHGYPDKGYMAGFRVMCAI
jgi:formylglycine-generating enzyme required for sulfatase activity